MIVVRGLFAPYARARSHTSRRATGGIAGGADEIEPDRRPMTLGKAAIAKVRLIVRYKAGGHQVEPGPAELATSPTLLSPIGVLG